MQSALTFYDATNTHAKSELAGAMREYDRLLRELIRSLALSQSELFLKASVKMGQVVNKLDEVRIGRVSLVILRRKRFVVSNLLLPCWEDF